MSSPDDPRSKQPSSPGVSAPARVPGRTKRRFPAATLDYGSAANRLDVLLLDADPVRGPALRAELESRDRAAVVVRTHQDAIRVCEGMRPVVLLASLAALSAGALEALEATVRSPGGRKIALLAFLCGDEAAAPPEGGPPVLDRPTPSTLVDELESRWPAG